MVSRLPSYLATMSPQAVTPLTETLARECSEVAELERGLTGFLPSQLPLAFLQDQYYAAWEALVKALPDYIKDRSIRQRIDCLPLLSVSFLRTIPEWRRAYVILSFLSHAYIWTGHHAAEVSRFQMSSEAVTHLSSQVLPRQVSVPLLQVSAYLELPPVATYSALNLWNFSCSDRSTQDWTSPDSLKAIHTFTGTEDESWFYVISVAMEAQGAYIIPTMLRALDAVSRKDYATVISALHNLCHCIHQLHSLLGRMYEKCDPMIFYHQIRPFLAGSKNMAAAGLPNGVFYSEGDSRQGQWRQLRGGSNGQSSFLQFLDIVLGVKHTSSGNSSPDVDNHLESFHQEVRSYMPGSHRRFLERVSQLGSIRDLAAQSVTTPEQEQVRISFQAATTALAIFRNKHLEIVTRYIVIPSKRPWAEGSNPGMGLAQLSAGGGKGQAGKGGGLTGTGGTALLPFLKQVRDETYQAGYVEMDK